MSVSKELIVPGTKVVVTNKCPNQYGNLSLFRNLNAIWDWFETVPAVGSSEPTSEAPQDLYPSIGTILTIRSTPYKDGGINLVNVSTEDGQDMQCYYWHIRYNTDQVIDT